MDISGNMIPNRYYELQYLLEGVFHDLSGADMKIGAFNILAALSGWTWNHHFDNKKALDSRTLVKTLDDVYENLFDDMRLIQAETGIEIFTKVEAENPS